MPTVTTERSKAGVIVKCGETQIKLTYAQADSLGRVLIAQARTAA